MFKSTSLKSTTTIVVLCIALLFSCQSHEQNTDAAFKTEKEERLISGDSLETIEPVSHPVVKNPVALDEWSQYRIDTEKKIVQNENKIKQIKGLPNTNTRLFKKILEIEKDNNNLRIQMTEYNAEVKERRDKFLLQMHTDMHEIDSLLKELSANK